MLRALLELLRRWLAPARRPIEGRSGRWAAVRKAHLQKNGYCAACGKKTALEVHHVVPVHADASKELDADNLITLCRTTCHLLIGHLGDWHNFNRHVREDAALIQSRVQASKK